MGCFLVNIRLTRHTIMGAFLVGGNALTEPHNLKILGHSIFCPAPEVTKVRAPLCFLLPVAPLQKINNTMVKPNVYFSFIGLSGRLFVGKFRRKSNLISVFPYAKT